VKTIKLFAVTDEQLSVATSTRIQQSKAACTCWCHWRRTCTNTQFENF